MSFQCEKGALSHTPLEILRQDALQGRWSEAKRTCCALCLSESLDLEVVWAVWAKDADAVGAAIAKAERKPQRMERPPPARRLQRTVS
jgi:hypothetical protein